MINNLRILAIVPARGGSKGIKDKNIKEIEGRPLIEYTIEAAKRCEYIDEIVVSTDSEKIAKAAKKAGAKVPFLRPDELASDTARTIDMFKAKKLPFLRKFDSYSCKSCEYKETCKPWLSEVWQNE